MLIVVLTLVNFVLLVPGVTLPIYGVTITTQVEAAIIPEPIEVTVYEQTRSILGTVRELWGSADYLVSFLILLFSIIVPVVKGSMLLASLLVVRQQTRAWLVRLVDLIGKWSMADVFVVAVFLAFLATRDQAQANSFSVPVLLQQIDVGMQTQLTSVLGPGFHYFLAYCLFSVLWTQLLRYRLARA
ncbi:MAG: paraquat-inducible protein A [Acidobacteriota bacterium]|nr:paraquat-inducible protein A [Acidobacteriota bacterium]